jgi:dolichol kinase
MTAREGARRAVHLALGAGAWLLPVLGWEVVAWLSGFGCVFNLLLLHRLPLTRELVREGGGGRLGLILYPVVVLALVLVFRDQYVPIQAGWLALAVGDGLAPVFGALFSRPRWPWNASKTVPATAAAFAIAAALLTTLTDATLAFSAMGVGALAESLPGPVDDNLTVPMVTAAAVFLMGGMA